MYGVKYIGLVSLTPHTVFTGVGAERDRLGKSGLPVNTIKSGLPGTIDQLARMSAAAGNTDLQGM